MLVIRVLRGNVQLLADPVDHHAGDMVRAIRQLAELNGEVHGVFGIVHVGSYLNLQEFLLGLVEDQGH